MPTVPLFGTATFGKSANVTSQRRINLYLEASQDQDKTPTAYHSRPGLRTLDKTISPVANYESNGPAIGLMGVYVSPDSSGTTPPGDYLYVAYGQGFAIFPSMATGQMIGGTYSYPGAGIAMAWNGERGFAVDGGKAFWLAAPSPSVVSSDEAGVTFEWDGATSVCFIAGRFVVNVPYVSGRFAWSPLYPGIAVDWNALDYATAESCPDPLVAVAECRGELLLFGSQSLEFWAPTGGDDVFGRVGGSGIGWGLASRRSLAKHNEGMIFVGRNVLGERQVCRLTGYQVEVISTPAIDVQLQVDEHFDDWTACCFTSGGHSFYVLNLQTTSWAFDLTTGVWAEWQTEGGRWAGQYITPWQGINVVSDYRNGNLYEITPDVYTDDGQPILREIQSRHVAVDLERMTVDQVALDAEVGVGLSTGQGSDPQVMMQYSKDGGHTFSNEMWETLGALGEYGKRVVWNRLGRARDWVFRFRVTDSVKVVLLGAAMRIRK